MDIKKELEKKQTCLLEISSDKYNSVIVENIKKLAGKSVCYVTLNKTSESLTELFKKSKIKTENIVFIDAISKTFKKISDQSKNCYYVNSPGALTELSITIKKFLGHNFEYLVFDSVTNMTVYQSKGAVIKFVSDIVNKIKSSKTKAVFYSLKIKEQEALIKQISMFFDNVLG